MSIHRSGALTALPVWSLHGCFRPSNSLVKVVADHEHVQVLVDGVGGVGTGGVGGGRQHVRVTHDLQDVRSVPAARALRVVRVDGASFERSQSVLHARAFVQCVRVDHHLEGAPTLTQTRLTSRTFLCDV